MRNFKRRKLFFNEEKHSYTDERGIKYTSMTTILGKYEDEFNTKEMARKVSRKYWNKRGHKYYRMTPLQIEEKWKQINKEACDKGNTKHNYFEMCIKNANGYNKSANGIYINDYIYTIDDILDNHDFGKVNIDYFKDSKIDERYPEIYNVLAYHANNDWDIYAEVGVYNPNLIVSGLIDVFMKKGNLFRILDWKTNKRKLLFEAGYYKRDQFGNETEEFIPTPHKKLKAPLDNIEEAAGNIYTLQVSGYAWLVEQFGLKLDKLFLAHIRDIKDENGENKEIVDFYPITYLKQDVERMFYHHDRIYNTNKQSKLIF